MTPETQRTLITVLWALLTIIVVGCFALALQRWMLQRDTQREIESLEQQIASLRERIGPGPAIECAICPPDENIQDIEHGGRL